MEADRGRNVYDPKISPPGAGPSVACPPTGAGTSSSAGSSSAGSSSANSSSAHSSGAGSAPYTSASYGNPTNASYADPSAGDPSAGNPSASRGNGTYREGARGGSPPPQESLRTVSTLIAELKEYAAYYLSTKIDGIKITLRNVGIFSVLGIVGLIAGSAFISTAAVLTLVGAAWGLGRLFSPSYDETKFLWLGALIVGVLFFTAIGLGAWLGLKKLTGTFKKALVNKYEQRQNWERGQFGRNVRERAAEAKS